MGRLLGAKGLTMRRYWIEKKSIYNDVVTFKDELFHHIFDVCRQAVGHHFEVLTEDSKAYLVEVTSVEKKQAQAKIIEEREIKKLPRPHIHIALSVSRYNVMDAIVEKAVEMGVSSILPFCSEFSFIRRPQNLPDGKLERWNKIVVSATQQSGRGELMKISELVEWSNMLQFINPSPKNWCLFAYEGTSILGVREHLQSLKKALNDSNQSEPENLWIIVGSEGGFSETEVSEMQQLGLNPVTLGSQVLRVETACMTLVSVLKYEFGLLK
ncbi:MAG: RsmE family RNA methyltransferase [Pseudobdellovibrio sp.]